MFYLRLFPPCAPGPPPPPPKFIVTCSTRGYNTFYCIPRELDTQIRCIIVQTGHDEAKKVKQVKCLFIIVSPLLKGPAVSDL